MPNLIVTSAVLEESSAALAAIKKEFDSASDRVPENDDVWGQEDLKGAMQQFVWNWGMHRDVISNDVEQLHKMVDDMVVGWTNIERQLSEGLSTEAT